MQAAKNLSGDVGVATACDALAIPRASYYRWLQPEAERKPRPSPPRALALEERCMVRETLNCEEFADLAPAQVYAKLLDQETYLCSVRTMYRVLEENGEVRERRDQLRHPEYKKPELLATGPNEVWSWDITKLLGPTKWTYYYLYVILDIFSRYVVGWLLAERESADLAKRLIEETIEKQNVIEDQLTLHSDRGPSMKSNTVAQLLAGLGVTKSHSRPYTSNDNPFSEAQFKTLKYQPGFPRRFGCMEDGRTFCRPFFDWYNNQHCHSGIGLMTPSMVHHGYAKEIYDKRQIVLRAAYKAHPERFVRKPPQPPALQGAVWINPPSLPCLSATQTSSTRPGREEVSVARISPSVSCDELAGLQLETDPRWVNHALCQPTVPVPARMGPPQSSSEPEPGSSAMSRPLHPRTAVSGKVSSDMTTSILH